MLHTKLGNILVTVDGNMVDYETIELTNEEKNFKVDQRYKLSVKVAHMIGKKQIVECILDNIKNYVLECYPETGEGLAMISCYYKNVKLSIGTLGDIVGVQYEYLKDRIRLHISNDLEVKKVVFYIAWLTMEDMKKEDIYTWFAADPTL